MTTLPARFGALLCTLALLATAAPAQPPGFGYKTWKPPVANLAALPATGNATGDARITLDDFRVYVWDGNSWETAASGVGSGTVTSVALAVPAEWTVSGSPVTGAGTITIAEATQTANTVYAGPTTGAAAAPGFRALVSADIPNNAADTSGNAATATALAANPTDCNGTDKATAIAASGNLTCGADLDTDDQAATEVPYTPTTASDWTDPDPTHAGGALDALAARLNNEEGKADDDVPDAGEVTVSALANGTDGELITWDATGVAATVAAGTSGQVLTSNGAGAAPTFQDAASSGIGGSTGATDDAILAADGTGGATLQARDLTISDVAGGVVTLATTAGNALAIANTNPEATTGASVAGDPLTITAGNAVASTDTAGAAAGGSVTIAAGNAARLTSGNANGGDINLTTGAGIGTGTAGQIVLPDGVEATKAGIRLNSGAAGTGWIYKDGGWAFLNASGARAYLGSSFGLGSASQLYWNSNNAGATGNDTGLARNAAGVVRATNGSTGIRGFLGGGAAVASATALPVPTGRVFHVTGTTTVTSITSTNFGSGVCVTLIFDDALTFTDGSNLKLAGDFVTTADDTISLCYDGTNWFETGRSIN